MTTEPTPTTDLILKGYYAGIVSWLLLVNTGIQS